jgi:hypothetical protein
MHRALGSATRRAMHRALRPLRAPASGPARRAWRSRRAALLLPLLAACAGDAPRGVGAPGPAPGLTASRLAALEAGVAAAVDDLRRRPAGLAEALARHRAGYRGRILYPRGSRVGIATAEGVAAVDEARAHALRAAPRPPLRLSPGLSRAARSHAAEIGRAGTLGHAGRDGSRPRERMERHGEVRGLSGESIAVGPPDAGLLVMNLFIDDGVAGRGHRRDLLEPRYRVLGVGCAAHARWQSVCVLGFAEGFRE